MNRALPDLRLSPRLPFRLVRWQITLLDDRGACQKNVTFYIFLSCCTRFKWQAYKQQSILGVASGRMEGATKNLLLPTRMHRTATTWPTPNYAFLSSLVSYKYSTILVICWICAFVNCDWQSDLIFFSIACFSAFSSFT